jgi:hypothetical protein
MNCSMNTFEERLLKVKSLKNITMKNQQDSVVRFLKTMRPLFLISLFVLSCLHVSAQNGTINFSGNWTLNESKSNLGDGPFRMAATVLTVKQEGNNLSIDRTIPGPDGQEMKISGKYTLDGKVSENAGMMDMITKSKITWSAEKNSITIASSTLFNMNGDNMEMKSTEIWKLEGDKILKIEATNSTPDGDMKTSIVYDKK